MWNSATKLNGIKQVEYDTSDQMVIFHLPGGGKWRVHVSKTSGMQYGPTLANRSTDS